VKGCYRRPKVAAIFCLAGTTAYNNQGEIWRGRVHREYTLARQILRIYLFKTIAGFRLFSPRRSTVYTDQGELWPGRAHRGFTPFKFGRERVSQNHPKFTRAQQ